MVIANRGEIAIRISRSAAALGIGTVGVFPEDDAASLHIRHVDDAVRLEGRGARAYLDAQQIIRVALETGCDAIHPGYGFLSERADFAASCMDQGLRFIGPAPAVLEQLGDKQLARELAEDCGVPILPGGRVDTPEEAVQFLDQMAPGAAIVIKAVAGGGGRGLRVVRAKSDVEEAVLRCRSEATASFGHGSLLAERHVAGARHIEVQILGDGSGEVTHLGDRDCSVQRRHQKFIEVAPSPFLNDDVRARLVDAAVRMAASVKYRGAGTFEFLVEELSTGAGANLAFYFLEANPRLQVEHTVTEEVYGVDLVAAQIRIAGGSTLADLGLDQLSVPPPRGSAMQLRVNLEDVRDDGTALPGSGVLEVFEVPTGPGVRVDSCGYAGYEPTTRYDPLLFKVVVHIRDGSWGALVAKAYRALGEVRVEGVATNVSLLQRILQHPTFVSGPVTTEFVHHYLAELLEDRGPDAPVTFGRSTAARTPPETKVDTTDPLAVLEHGRSPGSSAEVLPNSILGDVPERVVQCWAPLRGIVTTLFVNEAEVVRVGQQLAVLEAMKMEHVVVSETGGTVARICVAEGDTVSGGQVLIEIVPGQGEDAWEEEQPAEDLDVIRADLTSVQERHAGLVDESRPEAVKARHRLGYRTARENIADLCDAGSFVEYGGLTLAAQRQRHSLEELIRRSPADGLVAGVGTVNANRFPDGPTRCVVMSYDYTVFAGTQGIQNHRKKDRMFELAERWRLPIVFFTEGGGGRPSDTDGVAAGGLDVMAFHLLARLSGLVPLVGVTNGRCFAGNAALLGFCDTIIATVSANIGMGGPAMVEGGGLGVFRPEEIGPSEIQAQNGVIDVLVQDEEAATGVAKQYLSYFQGDESHWTCADQRRLRGLIPEYRLRTYDVRAVLLTFADTDSVLELRRHFAPGMITALARVEGRPVGVIANNPAHLGGAIDSDGADKAARFMQLCDGHGVPLLFLCDTPGIMVGPEVEKTGLVRHAARMFVVGAGLRVPFFTVVLRKAYGLGGQTMAGGTFRAPFFTVAWPTGEFGGMGLEGAVKLGHRSELAAIDDADERRARFDELVSDLYDRGRALNAASHFEIDDVIDPADTRAWVSAGLAATVTLDHRTDRRRPCIDPW